MARPRDFAKMRELADLIVYWREQLTMRHGTGLASRVDPAVINRHCEAMAKQAERLACKHYNERRQAA